MMSGTLGSSGCFCMAIWITMFSLPSAPQCKPAKRAEPPLPSATARVTNYRWLPTALRHAVALSNGLDSDDEN
jgi:hypothetical protein